MTPNSASKSIIAVDIDDVIYPLVPSLIGYLDTEHKARFTEADFKDYDFRKVWGGGPVEAAAIFEQFKEKSGIQVAPIKGCAEAIHKLSENYEVIVITARDISVADRTLGWVTHHFPKVFKDVHLVGNKHDSGDNWRPKAEVCVELGVSWLIDDNLDTILKTHAAGVGALLFGNYPWNQATELPEGVTRVKDWQAVLEYFDGKS